MSWIRLYEKKFKYKPTEYSIAINGGERTTGGLVKAFHTTADKKDFTDNGEMLAESVSRATSKEEAIEIVETTISIVEGLGHIQQPTLDDIEEIPAAFEKPKPEAPDTAAEEFAESLYKESYSRKDGVEYSKRIPHK